MNTKQNLHAKDNTKVKRYVIISIKQLKKELYMLEFAGRFSDPKLMIKQGKYWSIIFKEITTLYEFTYAYGLSY